MPTDMERMIVALEARTKSFENALAKSNNVAQKQLRSIENQFAKTNKKLAKGLSFGGLSDGIGAIRGGVAGIGGVFAVDKVRKYADAWTEAGNKIAAAGAVAGRSGRSLSDINKIATDTRSGLTETVDLYAKLLRSTKDVAKNEQEVATATEIVNKAFKAGGAAASEQTAGVLQLSQALGSGLLAGDELRSIRENAPLIAAAIAKEFNTTIGGLKQLGADGKLTVDRVFRAILKAKPEIDRAYGSTSATIADGFTLVNNAVTEAIGKINDVTGAGKDVGASLAAVAVIIDGLANSFENIAGSPAGKFLGFLGAVIKKLEPVQAGLRALADSKMQNALGSVGDRIVNMTQGASAEQQLNGAVRALDRFFTAAKNGVKQGFLSKEQGDAIENIRAQLKAGAMDAEAAKVAIAKVGEMKPGTARELSGRFDPLIKNLQDLVKAANEAARATSQIGLNTDDRADSRKFQSEAKAYGDFITGRNADASRTDMQKQIDERADKIVEAAGKVGIAITEAAAKIQAAKEIASESIAKQASASANDAMGLIKDFEGFRSKAYWDVNHYRVGYGSDTTTDESGRKSVVTAGTVVNLAEADRDLLRRIGDTQQAIRDKIGADTFNGMDEKQQAALTSIAYNYGSLPQRIVDAIKTGNQATVVQAIRGLGNDNGGVNRDRRNTEADLFLGGAPSGVRKAVKGQDRFGNSLDDTQREIDLLNKQVEALGLVNPLIDDYGFATTKAEVKQRLLNDAQENGIEVTPELAAKIDTLADKYAKASAAGEQLQDAQSKLVATMEQSSAFGKDVLGGFISDLKDGKSASEALAGALDKVADKLLDIALNNLFDGMGKPGGGGGLFGGLFSFLFAKDGGVYAHGRKQPLKTFARGGVSRSAAIFGEAGPEAAVPLPDGRRIPVELRSPSMKAGGGSTDVVRVVLQDDSGRMAGIADQRIQTHSGTIVQVSVQQSVKAVKGQMPGMIANAQARSM